MSEQNQKKMAKRTFWTIALFYALIAFEFIYMAGPFAIYFYAAYRPGLNYLIQIPGVAWLTGFFLPHIVVETSSTMINMHNIIGAVLTVIGFIIFCITAAQVYYAKIMKTGVVTDGIYNLIRHPQYTSFAICSFGLLLLWPRFLVLVMYVTLLYAYYFLARLEEQECEAKFGQPYLDYKQKTNMFLPIRIFLLEKWTETVQRKIGNVFILLILYLSTLAISLGLAMGIQTFSLNRLYLYTAGNTAYLSVSRLEEEQLKQIAEIAIDNEEVQARLNQKQMGMNTNSLNYVIPAEWYISEIPMHEGKQIIKNTRTITPVLEVWLDLSLNKVTDIKEPPVTSRYENVPVPVY
jgi:protein-S-isoprenylcysteine O-methyltransferase Ste14